MAADSAPPIRLAVDLMGGDHGPSVTLPACRAFLAAHPDAELVLVGRAEAIAHAAGWPRCTRVAAQRGRRDDRFGRDGAAPQEGLVAARRGQPGQAARRSSLARPGLRLGRQHRRADGRLALRPEDRRRHRPAGDRHRHAERARRLHDRARPRRQRRLHGRAPAPVRGHGQRARRRRLGQGRADGRPAQHRRGSDQGRRSDQAGGRAAARRGGGGHRQLPRQRRGQRHLQGNDRHRRLRRLRRQRHAEDRRGARVDADDASSSRSSRATRSPSSPRWRRCRC